MKKFYRNMILLLLALALAATGLVACKKDTPDLGKDSTGTGTKEAQTTNETGYAPLENRDFGEKTFNVLLRSEYKDEFDIQEETNTPVPDAVYRRNQRVEELYGLHLKFTDVVDDWDHRDTFTNAIHQSVILDDSTAYDFIIGAQSYIAFNVANGDLQNLNEIPHLTLDAPWWGQQAVDALTINNVCYQATGDFAVSMLESMNCVYFNKALKEENQVADLYEAVNNKKWTHDMMVSISKDINTDLNDNGYADDEDKYGLVAWQTEVRSAIVIYNTPTLTKEGRIIWNTAHTQSVAEKIVDAFNEHSGIYYTEKTNEAQDIFFNGRAMLLWGRLDSASVLREMVDDFGIIPCPMFDEAQDEYYTTSNDASMVCVPVTKNKDVEEIGFVIEAICRESTDTVAETFYKKALTTRNAPDVESAKMIDLIRRSLTYDFGWVYSTQTGVSGNQYQIMMNEDNTNFSGWYASQESVINGKLKDCFALFGVELED